MGEDSRLRGKVKGQMTRFASQLSAGWTKPLRRFAREMVYGIQASEDVKVSEIARSLGEPIRLLKTETRLCRNLAGTDLTDRINRFLSWEGAGRVGPETVLALDLGDLTKPYARAMQHLARVRDGSTGQLARGYWLCEVVAAEVYGDTIVPLYGELYSQEAEGFESENAQLWRAIDRVSEATGGRGLWAIDRGGDRRKLLIPMLDRRLRFVVRSQGRRHVVLPGGRRCTVREAARWCRTETEREVEVERDGRRTRLRLRLGSMRMYLPERTYTPLELVVIRGFGAEPILLLTNVPPETGRRYAAFIADVYLVRWKCEETYRFVKQAYHLEDVRVRGYVALRNMYALVTAVLYFVSVVIGGRSKVNLIFKRVCERAKRFYGVAAFFQYAVADGIHRLLNGTPLGSLPAPRPTDDAQLAFAFTKPPP